MHVAYTFNCQKRLTERHDKCKKLLLWRRKHLIFDNENNRKHTLIKLTSFALSVLQIIPYSN